jgi:hypothetical protein
MCVSIADDPLNNVLGIWCSRRRVLGTRGPSVPTVVVPISWCHWAAANACRSLEIINPGSCKAAATENSSVRSTGFELFKNRACGQQSLRSTIRCDPCWGFMHYMCPSIRQASLACVEDCSLQTWACVLKVGLGL